MHGCDDPDDFNVGIEYLCNGDIGLQYYCDLKDDVDLYLDPFFSVQKACEGIADVRFRLCDGEVPLNILDALRKATPARAKLGMEAEIVFK